MTDQKMTKNDAEDKTKDLEEDQKKEATEDLDQGSAEEEKETPEDGSDKKDDQDNEDNKEEEKEEEKEDDEDLNTKYLRLMADFQNFKKRSQKQRSDTLAYANAEIVGQLLEVMDNFERALEQDADEGQEGFKEGMQMIFDQLKGVLDKTGVEEIKAIGEVFDPNFHNAVMTEDTDEYESGHVSGVMQKGYMLKGRVVRPSMVKVAN